MHIVGVGRQTFFSLALAASCFCGGVGISYGGPFPAEFELSSLLSANGGDGSAGFVLNGIDAYDRHGMSVSAAGDVNADGIDDVIVGSHDADPGGRNSAGESYVVFGSDQGFPAEFELSNLLSANGGDGSVGFILNGIEARDQAGGSVSAAGDVNADGIGDVIVGAREQGLDDDGGESYVVFGSDQGFPAEYELSNLLSANGGDGSAGFIRYGTAHHDDLGFSVSAAGDVNGDDIDDVIAGAYGASAWTGASYVIFGSDQGFAPEFELSDLLAANGGDGSLGFVLNGISPGDASGVSVSEAGDVNADGFDDVILCASHGSPGGRTDAGQSYVIFGSDQGFAPEFELSDLLAANGGDGSAGFVLNGIDAYDVCSRVSAAGDVNADGIGDVVVGSPYADPGGRNSAGESYVVFGSDQGFPAEFELSNLLSANGGDGSRGFVLKGIAAEDFLGVSVSAAGDVNGDSIDDLIVGAHQVMIEPEPDGSGNVGESYVVFGTDQGFLAEFELSDLLAANGGDGSAGFVLKGIDAEDVSGHSVSEAGDVNGDGIDDLIIGAIFADPGGREYAGESYVVFGRRDLDDDTIVDSRDNCVEIENTDQRDTDSDGIGNACDPDISMPNNCVVNFGDLGVVKTAFFSNPSSPSWNPDADFNGDGAVNFADLSIIETYFFGPPGPSGLPNACNE